MLKITQNNLGWEFCTRICGRDGKPLTGIRIDAATALTLHGTIIEDTIRGDTCNPAVVLALPVVG